MKIIKILNRELSNMEALLTRAGLTHEKQAHPNLLLVNETTYKKISKAVFKAFKKENPFASKKQIDFWVSVYLLDLGPGVIKNDEGGKALATGHAIINASEYELQELKKSGKR